MNYRLSAIVTTVALCLVMLPTSAQAEVTGKIIVIDPGHGGLDPGTETCADLPEAEVNFDVATRLQTLLQDNNTVFLTRDEYSDPSNTERANVANDNHADILVSIHFNSSPDIAINYTQGLFSKWKKDKDLANTLHQSLLGLPDVTDGGLLQFASGAILKADMPATIQEVAFLSNPEECARLKEDTKTRQQLIADRLYDGIDDWFNTPTLPTKPGNR